MALHLAPPPPARKARERFADLTKSKDDTLSLWVGLVASLLLWFALLAVASLVLKHVNARSESLAHTPPPPPVFSIELAQDEFQLPEKAPPPEKLPQRFVETNPDAPENVPDETRNFAAHNQQAAQEKPTQDNSDLPSTKGEAKEETTQIVSGSLNQPPPDNQPPPPPPSPELMQAVKEAQAQRERNPLTGDQKITGESENGYGFNLSKATKNVENIPERQEGSADAPLVVTQQTQNAQQRVEMQKPLPRPRLDRKVRPAVLADRPLGTSNIGITAADARWSQYGQYLQRLVDSVQIEWERILDSSKLRPPPGSMVKVVFVIDQEGNIAEIAETESNAGNLGTRACQSAITARAPYGKWTDDMIAALGEKQELTFTFFYY